MEQSILQYAFVLDQNKQPLDICYPARARELLRKGRAVVFRRFPFTILLKDRQLDESVLHAQQVKLDPGSRITGMALAGWQPCARDQLSALPSDLQNGRIFLLTERRCGCLHRLKRVVSAVNIR